MSKKDIKKEISKKQREANELIQKQVALQIEINKLANQGIELQKEINALHLELNSVPAKEEIVESVI